VFHYFPNPAKSPVYGWPGIDTPFNEDQTPYRVGFPVWPVRIVAKYLTEKKYGKEDP
jgi:hypothetical protein